MLATAESSQYEAEARAFRSKAEALTERNRLDPALLAYPREELKVAVVMAELTRVKKLIEAYEAEDQTWATKTAEWAALLDEFDEVLEVACDVLCLPLNRLPYGCRRHFRPTARARIEALLWERVATGDQAAFEGHTFESLLGDSTTSAN